MENLSRSMNDVKAAQFLGLQPQTLRNWRCQGRGPSYICVGRRRVYLLNDLVEYQKKHRIDPES